MSPLLNAAFLRHSGQAWPVSNLTNIQSSTSTSKSCFPGTGQRTEDTENTETAVAPILLLPTHVRHRIYLHTEVLARFEDQRYAVLNLNGGTPVPSGLGYFPEEKFGFYGLLLFCRTI